MAPPKFLMFKLVFSFLTSNLMKVIHVKLCLIMNIFTCLTKDEKLECLKYFGKIRLSKLLISLIIKLSPFGVHETIG